MRLNWNRFQERFRLRNCRIIDISGNSANKGNRHIHCGLKGDTSTGLVSKNLLVEKDWLDVFSAFHSPDRLSLEVALPWR